MIIAPKYNPAETEDKWYSYWLDKKYFSSKPNEKDAFTIVIPPPNVTGVLHMGHMLNNTIQDVLVRRARMLGYNACWLPGTDHASIATESKVVNKLANEGIDKNDLSRDEFLQHAWEWKEKHGGIILDQLKKLGASCDWDRTSFTMDESLYESVIKTFVDMYNKGLIYRGARMVNWDPKALTALSDEEVIHKEVQSKLYYIRYQVEGQDEWLTIATTRPETILGDTAVCIHPDDERFKHLHGKRLLVPLINRSVPIIVDDYVDLEFGTGCLKITPAHDENDYKLGLKHNLESIEIFNDNGTLNENAQLYIGEDRFVCRKKISKELTEKGYLIKEEDYTNKVGYSERTDEVIEPKMSTQWFMKMDDISKPALDVVMNDEIQFHPPKFKNTYKHWMENIRDWCISRQLWWGQRIPAFYLPNGEVIVAETAEQALKIANEKYPEQNYCSDQLKQDEDVLDTWFSSWLWPISVFDGIRNPDNEDIKYYYPTNDLVTAPEIMFFWVARMIMAGLEYRNEVPFKNVYFTGIVRDNLGRKMSKSLGNSPDPIELMKQYGADGVRIGLLLTSPAGNDLPFDESLCEQGRNFSNKVWNALRLIKGWEIDDSIPQADTAKTAINWFNNKFNKTLKQIDELYAKFKLSDVSMSVYKLIWDDFCSNYLEIIKPAYQKPIDKETYNQTIAIFDKLMRVAHPFMPFITEEIWQILEERKDGESIMISQMPLAQDYDEKLLKNFDFALEMVNAIRNIRIKNQMPNKDSINLFIKDNKEENINPLFDNVIAKLCNIESIEYVTAEVENTITSMIGKAEIFIPQGDNFDAEAEKAKLEEELKYQEGFLNSVMKKLSNDKFVNNAPAKVVEAENKKKQDAEAKILLIKEKLAHL